MQTIEPSSERVTVAAVSTLLSVADIKAQNRITHTAEDGLLALIASSVDSYIENYTGLALMQKAYAHTFERWGNALCIKRSPNISIASVVYVDEESTPQTLATDQYVVETGASGRTLIRPAAGVVWPSVDRYSIFPITVNGLYGHASASDVDAGIVQAARWVAGSLYQHREAEITGTSSNALKMGVDSFLLPHVVW